MKVSLADHGAYYRGLLVLIRRDRAIHEAERSLMMRIGRALGFEESFCAEAIREILENEYIADDPPRFADPEIARSFLRDGIRLALADGTLDASERALLGAVAGLHRIDDTWLQDAIEIITAQEGTHPPAVLDAERLHWK